MLTENIYNYRMDYPGLFVPHMPQFTKADGAAHPKFHYPISPPHHSIDIASSPPRSAFTAVKSSSSGQTNRQSLELLHSLYANQLASTCYNNLFSSPASTINFPPSPASSHNSPTRPSSAAMIEQLMRQRRSPPYSDDSESIYNANRNQDSRLIHFTEADENHKNKKSVLCVEESSEHMARQRHDLVQRTSVIKSVIADDPSSIRSAVQRQSSDSCGGSSASSSSASSVDEEIVCRWSDCFRLVRVYLTSYLFYNILSSIGDVLLKIILSLKNKIHFSSLVMCFA